jgi:hypothetical protein
MSRYDLTDFEWRVIQPLLPNKPRGVPRVDDRRVLSGIFWVLLASIRLWRRACESTAWWGVVVIMYCVPEIKVHMVGHQHPRPDIDASRGAMFGEQRMVKPIVVVAEEGLRAAIAALGHVMRVAGEDGASHACHGHRLAEEVVRVNLVECHRNS